MTGDHQCLHEVDLALMAERQEEMSKDMKEVLKLIKGDNSQGVITRVALLKQSVTRAWWWLGAISLGIIGLAIRGLFK